MRGTLAQRCVDRGLIRRRDLDRALEELRGTNERFSNLLTQLEIVPESRITEIFTRDVRRNRVQKADDFRIEAGAAKILDQDLAERYDLVPLQKRGSLLIVASCGLPDPLATADLRNKTGLCIVKEFCSPEVYGELRKRVFGGTSRVKGHVPQPSKEPARSQPAATAPPQMERHVEEEPEPTIEIVTARGKARTERDEEGTALKAEVVSASAQRETSDDTSAIQPPLGLEPVVLRRSPSEQATVDAPTRPEPERDNPEEEPAPEPESATLRGAPSQHPTVSTPTRPEPERDIPQEQPAPRPETRTPRRPLDTQSTIAQVRSAEDDVVGFVQSVLTRSIEREASDVHIEPTEKKVCVRYRVDGVMEDLCYLPKEALPPIVSRIKILSDLDIAERRAPQDGGMKVQCGEREIEFRVSTLPGIQGEKVVLRVLDPSAFMVDLRAIGFNPSVLAVYEQLIHRPHGVLLVTGPTGSGKTTTLYSTLHRIHTGATNIVTVEDPVEYRLEGINQVQVNPQAGITFASALRSILRQDPDVIMVGEMRDQETAETAIRSALTGHMVLSTLHTNDAPSAIIRLTDMGVPPYLVASSVSGVLAQRLVRILCPNCKQGGSPTAELLREIGDDVIARWRERHAGAEPQSYFPKGCEGCRRGFRGRLAIFELVAMTERLKKLITTTSSADEKRQAALDDGMISLWEDGVDKVFQGLTTYEEISRTVTRDG